MSRKFISFWLIILPVIVLLYAGLFLAIRLRYPEGLSRAELNSHLVIFSVLFIFWLLVFFIHGLFETKIFRRYTDIIFGLASAIAINVLVAITYFYIQPELILTPRRFLLVLAAVVFVLLLVWYLIVKYILKNRLFEEVYFFSFDGELNELEKEIKNHEYLGIKILGHLNEKNFNKANFKKDTGLILPDNLSGRTEIINQFFKLRTLGILFYNFQDFYENLLRRVYLSRLNEVWFLENVNYKEKRFYGMLKRLTDLLFGVLTILPFVVTFPAVALLIKLTSKGAIFFVQERVGKNGKIFKVYKYRTMNGGPTNTWTSVNDPRITTLGRFLRKSRIDELPQFINLIIGNMSLVGPRPEQPHIVTELKKQVQFYDERHFVKPGLTGWAQLNSTYAGSTEETKLKLQYDLYYIKNRRFLLDLEIILKTFYYVFTWKGR
ncbi:MAG: hypothetical protein COT92_02950 [Candidatus Doudnabacteria bacterium CG10_big_fil_rev_8_21_14_0_10_42_18]|uniref:Bacterial sugar transferase domain-containing protein n=1 Tax=Candidatus Doudnabacteria bacterium CG10_big_fil_rev_8_21_14_0_10_42_18 TaxID=1974552 RepID=A0A2H0VAG4_9BACT|nr:MAG: hypothetical protein COT92_02950 [Candidatus Doudnabacteria bacterium CG10_big_fil_rev_8_21_14_0_10_42_18]